MIESDDRGLGNAAADFMMAASDCAKIEMLDDRFRRFVQGQGFNSAMFVHLSSSGAPVSPRVVFGDPDPWIAHYNARRYARLDPTIPQAFTSRRAFTWGQAEKPDGSREQRDFFGEARELWAKDGLVVPVHGPYGEFSVVNLLSDRKIVLSDAERAVFEGSAQVYASQGLTLLFGALGAGPAPKTALTRREQECVYWMAQGKHDAEIAVILGLSQHTVRIYIDAAKTKLEVQTRPQLIAKALTFGYLVPDPAMLC
ncbi:MAG: autoinducer binding domain-containing protein [Caulobacteraceae bacterium]|nr:autoinducer binding domain-containing protein [Caulobacteraceae bacterium]